MALEAGHAPAIGALDGDLAQPRQHLLAGSLLTAPPGRDMRHLQIFVEEAAAQAWQEAEQRPRLEHARARHVGDDHTVLAQHVDQPGDAEMRGGIQLQRVEKI